MGRAGDHMEGRGELSPMGGGEYHFHHADLHLSHQYNATGIADCVGLDDPCGGVAEHRG
ncbi:UNVERIFIED_CONTAM: hypothetical protein GTU68_061431 [Idotea baltica]|nr:hypothetical protein [Idotea baltica]